MPNLDMGCQGTCGWNQRVWRANKYISCCRSHTFTISTSARAIRHRFSPNSTSFHHIINHMVVWHRKQVEERLFHNSAKAGTEQTPTAGDSLVAWCDSRRCGGQKVKKRGSYSRSSLGKIWKHCNAIVFDGATPSIRTIEDCERRKDMTACRATQVGQHHVLHGAR